MGGREGSCSLHQEIARTFLKKIFLRAPEEVNRFCVPLAFSHRVDTADQKYTEWSFMSEPCNEAAICTSRFLMFKKVFFFLFYEMGDVRLSWRRHWSDDGKQSHSENKSPLERLAADKTTQFFCVFVITYSSNTSGARQGQQ